MMERGDKQLTSTSQKKKIEPTFVPEWLKTTTAAGNSGISSHVSGSSSLSDDHTAGISSRSRLPVNACELDSYRSSVIADKSTLSYRRSSSTNGSTHHEKESWSHSRPYSSFGRSSRDRDREKDVDFHDREIPLNLENGFHDFPDSFMSIGPDKDTLRRSQSMVSGRRNDSWTKRAGNGVQSFHSGKTISSTINKASFDREFPSLGAGDKQGPLEIGKVSSPCQSSAIQSLSLGSSALIGCEGWTSALAEVPVVVVGVSGPPISSVHQVSSPSSGSNVSSTMTGLNMAETLAQAPRGRAAPQLSVENQKLEELAIKQYRQLIPMTPSMPKTLVLSSSEKLKSSKGSRNGDFSALQKAGQQPHVQPVNQSLRGSARPDVSKPSQVGSFHVLNRERNGISPTPRDGLKLTTSPGNLSPGVVPTAASTPLQKSPKNLKLKADSKAISSPVTAFLERRPVTQQNRSEFFNSLRKKTSSNNSNSAPEPSSHQPSALEKSDEKSKISCSSPVDTGIIASSVRECGLDYSEINRTDVCKDLEGAPKSDGGKSSCLDPAEEERLLRLLGWKENAGEEEEALTAEEIDAFIEEYQRLRPFSKFSRRNLRVRDTERPKSAGSGFGSGSSSFDS